MDGSGGLAIASTFTELVLVARSASGQVQSMKYDLLHGWSAEASPAVGPVAALGLASFAHETKIMLALRDDVGRTFPRGFAAPVCRQEPGAKPSP